MPYADVYVSTTGHHFKTCKYDPMTQFIFFEKIDKGFVPPKDNIIYVEGDKIQENYGQSTYYESWRGGDCTAFSNQSWCNKTQDGDDWWGEGDNPPYDRDLVIVSNYGCSGKKKVCVTPKRINGLTCVGWEGDPNGKTPPYAVFVINYDQISADNIQSIKDAVFSDIQKNEDSMVALAARTTTNHNVKSVGIDLISGKINNVAANVNDAGFLGEFISEWLAKYTSPADIIDAIRTKYLSNSDNKYNVDAICFSAEEIDSTAKEMAKQTGNGDLPCWYRPCQKIVSNNLLVPSFNTAACPDICAAYNIVKNNTDNPEFVTNFTANLNCSNPGGNGDHSGGNGNGDHSGGNGSTFQKIVDFIRSNSKWVYGVIGVLVFLIIIGVIYKFYRKKKS